MDLVCVLHEVAREMRRPGTVILFGMSLCRNCSVGAAAHLAEDGSVRDLLKRAREGELP